MVCHLPLCIPAVEAFSRFRASDSLHYYKPVFVRLIVLQVGSVFTSHSLIFDRLVWSPVLESNQLLQFCRLIPRRRAYRACWMVFSTIWLCCVGVPTPGLLAGSTSKKPSMCHPVEDRTPISRVRILFPNQLEDRTL